MKEQMESLGIKKKSTQGCRMVCAIEPDSCRQPGCDRPKAKPLTPVMSIVTVQVAAYSVREGDRFTTQCRWDISEKAAPAANASGRRA